MYPILAEPPMQLGETLKGTDADSNLINSHYLGQICYFPHKTLQSDKFRASGKPNGAVLLRNTSGVTFLGKRLALLDRTAGYDMVHEANGYSGAAIAARGVVLIDPWLPSTGVAANDIFWGVFSGPALVLLPLTDADHTTDIAVNDDLVSATGTTTGVTTSGRVTHVRFTNATAGETGAAFNAYNMIAGKIGRAMSARTSRETTAGADILVDLMIPLWGR